MHYVQFSYRLLGFVALFGSLLSACVLATIVPRRMSAATAVAVAAGVAIVLALSAASYFPTFERHPRGAVRWIVDRPVMSGRTDYQLASRVTALTSMTHPELDLAGEEFGLLEKGRFTERAEVTVAVPAGATALEVKGRLPGPTTGATTNQVTTQPAARADGVGLSVAVGSAGVSRTVAAEPFDLTVPLAAGDVGQRALSVALAVAPRNGFAAQVQMDSIRWVGARPSHLDLLPAAEMIPRMHYGRRTWCDVSARGPTLVVVPVLYYPRLLAVHVNGRPVPYGNLGRFVALELPPGEYRVEVWFTGVRWANAAGMVGLGILLLAALIVARHNGATPVVHSSSPGVQGEGERKRRPNPRSNRS
jgi:hypothetical protein